MRLAFAMAINKSQAQSFKKVGVHLTEDVFSYGQLYVALSRGRRYNDIKVKSPTNKLMSVVYSEVLT